MSSVLLMVGQCGNQIGHDLMKLIDSTTDSNPLTHRDGKIRCVCVDSEPKVIKANMADDRKRSYLYRDDNVVIGQRGRGNNWALGYHGLLGQETEETSLLHRTLGVLRKEVERCDRFAGSILIHSLTGGTGSGLGSRLLEEIRDAFPMAHVVSVAIAPHVSGDSPLQHYNSLLSLASLQRNADGIVVFSNDDVLHSLLARPGNHGKSTLGVSIKQMNQYIATSLAGVLLPLECKPKRNSKSRSEEKKCSPKGKCRITRQRIDSSSPSLRGSSVAQDATTVNDFMHSVENCNMEFSSLASEDSLSVMSRQPKRSNSALLRYRGQYSGAGSDGEASLTLCQNSTSVTETITNTLQKAKLMYDAGAYLHWFWKHGCSEEDFTDAFNTLESVVEEYQLAVA